MRRPERTAAIAIVTAMIAAARAGPASRDMFALLDKDRDGRITRKEYVGTFVAALVIGCVSLLAEPGPGPTPSGPGPSPAAVAARKDFSFGYWPNGWRKSAEDTSPDILCFETGHYGFLLDVDDLTKPRFGTFSDHMGYRQALASGVERLKALRPAELAIELKVDGRIYRAVTCRAGVDKDLKRLSSARLWESGRLVQHFDLLDLRFQDDAGNPLACCGTLDLVAWPGSLTLTAELTPDFIYEDGPCQGAVGNGLCIADKPLDIPHSPELEPEKLTVECWVNIPEKMDRSMYGWLLCKNEHEWGQGNYGFMFRRGTAIAVLNIAGGKDQQQTIAQRGKLAQGKWHHLALTYDGATMHFYLDGKRQGTKTIGKARVPGKGLLRIGKRADGNFAVVNGLYDQIRIWDRALSKAEVAAHARQPAQLPSREGLTFEKSFDKGAPVTPPVWTDAELSVRLKSKAYDWQAEKRIAGAWQAGERQHVTLACNISGAPTDDETLTIQLSTPDNQTFPVAYRPEYGCHVAEVKGLERSFRCGYVKITDYDELDILLEYTGRGERAIPFLLDLRRPANITGLVPILCREDGTPTGVPVQLSKNWHYRPMGAYLRAYTLIPVKPGPNRYRLRIVYGFYGTLPSASHAQLSLVGYGGNGRWDQLALACGGEAITFDADMSLTHIAVCDVRLPLGRNGKDGNPWGWTDAGWGGDWLGVFGAENWKLAFTGMKTAYLAHGPCLTDVRYKGAYGAGREVLLDARVQFPRADDYARTFQKLTYRFQRDLDAADTYFLRRHARAFDTCVAYGNRDGLIEEKRVTGDIGKGDLLVPPTELSGQGPWWVAFPGRTLRGQKNWGFGYVSLVIRAYEATFGGKTFRNPFLMVRVEERQADEAKLETWLVPPPGVDTYRPGDQVELDTQWLHLHRNADDYGGPNAAYRKHLEESPQSWKTTYREVKGNDLDIAVKGGRLVQKLPIVIHAEQPEISVDTRGGVGFVPIRFDGLAPASSYALYEDIGGRLEPLNRSAYGNDFWQTDYDATSNTYSMSLNLPLDGKASSSWVLKRKPSPH